VAAAGADGADAVSDWGGGRVLACRAVRAQQIRPGAQRQNSPFCTGQPESSTAQRPLRTAVRAQVEVAICNSLAIL